MSRDVLQAIRDLFTARCVDWEEIEHEPVRTAEDAARVRGWPLERGAKALVFKVDGVFGVYVLSAAKEMRSSLVRRHRGARRTRFATAAELAELTDVEPGAVPPFGRPIFDLPLFADPSVLAHQRIAFTPGVRTVSMMVASADWEAVAEPDVFPFSR